MKIKPVLLSLILSISVLFSGVSIVHTMAASPEVITQVETTTSSTVVVPPTEVSPEDKTMLITYLVLILLALLGIAIGSYFAFRKSRMTSSTVNVSAPNQPAAEPTTVQISTPENNATVVSVSTPKAASDQQTGV